MRVRLTEDGMARVSAALADLLRFERDLLQGVEPDVRDALADALRRLLVSFEGR